MVDGTGEAQSGEALCSGSQSSQAGFGAQSSGTRGCGLCVVALGRVHLAEERHLAPPRRAASPGPVRCGAGARPLASPMKEAFTVRGGEGDGWEWALLQRKLRGAGLGPRLGGASRAQGLGWGVLGVSGLQRGHARWRGRWSSCPLLCLGPRGAPMNPSSTQHDSSSASRHLGRLGKRWGPVVAGCWGTAVGRAEAPPARVHRWLGG